MRSCPKTADVTKLQNNAYKVMKRTPYTRRVAYKTANSAFFGAVRAAKEIEFSKQSGMKNYYCGAARSTYNFAKAQLVRAKRLNAKYTKR